MHNLEEKMHHKGKKAAESSFPALEKGSGVLVYTFSHVFSRFSFAHSKWSLEKRVGRKQRTSTLIFREL